MKKTVIAILAAACAIPAMAADGYAGAAIGRAEQKLTVDGIGLSENSTSFKVFGGMQLDKNFGAEVGYVAFGKATVSGDGASISAEPSSLYIAATGTLPVTAELSAYGKLGVARTHTKATASMGGTTESDSTNHTSAMFGLGVSYALSPKMAIFGEYENFGKVIDEDGVTLKVDHVAVGVRYKF